LPRKSKLGAGAKVVGSTAFKLSEETLKKVEALGPDAPGGPILAVRVADIGVKDALVADDPDVYFTTPHFNGYPAVLVCLDQIDVAELRELLVEAWLARAPKRLAQAYLDAQP